jgi:putative DNA primase/helicase
MTVEEFIHHLEMVRKNGPGWMAKCPAHDDRAPSLSITEGEDGRTLIKCHAGCATTEIVKAVGLRMSDLFLRRPPRPVRMV